MCYPGFGRKKRGGVKFLWVDTEQWLSSGLYWLVSACSSQVREKRGEYYSLAWPVYCVWREEWIGTTIEVFSDVCSQLIFWLNSLSDWFIHRVSVEIMNYTWKITALSDCKASITIANVYLYLSYVVGYQFYSILVCFAFFNSTIENLISIQAWPQNLPICYTFGFKDARKESWNGINCFCITPGTNNVMIYKCASRIRIL